MKYGLGIKFLIAFIVGGIAVLYKFRVDPKQCNSEISIAVKVPKRFLFDFVTETSNVPGFFSWISSIEEIDKRKNLTIGKGYRGTMNLPFMGIHDFRYIIKELEHGKWVVLKPDPIRGYSYFKPEVVLMVNSITSEQSQFYMKIIYHRDSALFQLTLGRIMKILTDSQLEKVAARVENLVSSKWKIWQNTPTTTNKTPPVTSNLNSVKQNINSTKSTSKFKGHN